MRRPRGQDPPTAPRGQGVDRYTRGFHPRVMGAVPIDPSNHHPLGSRPMAGRKVLNLEMRVRHLPPEHLKGGAHHATRSAETHRSRERSSGDIRRTDVLVRHDGEVRCRHTAAASGGVRGRSTTGGRGVNDAAGAVPAGPSRMGTGFVAQLIRVRVPGPAPWSCSSVGRARARNARGGGSKPPMTTTDT
jgi:hypothetical protein